MTTDVNGMKITPDLEARLIAQDHRTIHVHLNVWQSRSWRRADPDDPRVRAARSAFVWYWWRVFRNTTLVGGGTAIAIFTLVGLVHQNRLLTMSNLLFERQNELVEASRRAALIYELTAILDQLHIDYLAWPDHDEESAFKASDLFVARTVALSRSLRPYYPMQFDEHETAEHRLQSPERAQLLLSLIDAPGDTLHRVLTAGADFSYATLAGTDLSNKDLSNLYAPNCDLRGADLSGTSVAGAWLNGSLLIDVDFTGCDIELASFQDSVLTGAFLVDLKGGEKNAESPDRPSSDRPKTSRGMEAAPATGETPVVSQAFADLFNRGDFARFVPFLGAELDGAVIAHGSDQEEAKARFRSLGLSPWAWRLSLEWRGAARGRSGWRGTSRGGGIISRRWILRRSEQQDPNASIEVLDRAPSLGQSRTVVLGSSKPLSTRAAHALLAGEDFAGAADAFREIVEADPNNGDAWFHLGYSLHANGQLDEAIKANRKAALFVSFKGLALFNLSCAYSLMGEIDLAFESLAAARRAGLDIAVSLDDKDLDNLRDDPRFAALIAE